MLFLDLDLLNMLEERDLLPLLGGVLDIDRGTSGMRLIRGSGRLTDFASIDSVLICW